MSIQAKRSSKSNKAHKASPEDLSKHENATRILQVGWDLFNKKGYRGVSVDEICHACHLTKPTLYYYFQDKENLYVNVLRYRLRNFRQAIAQPGTLEDRLKRMLHVMLENMMPNMPSLIHDMENIRAPALHRQVADAFQTEFLEPLAVLMQSGIDSGELAPNNPTFYVWLFLGILGPHVARSHAANLDARTRGGCKHRPLGWAARNHAPDMDADELIDQLVRFFLQGAK